jgi:hypothetical protein
VPGFQKCKRVWVTAVILFAASALVAADKVARRTGNSAMVRSALAVGSKPAVPSNGRLPMVVICTRSTGFDPKENNSLSGRFLLAVDNQNGLAELSVRRGDYLSKVQHASTKKEKRDG